MTAVDGYDRSRVIEYVELALQLDPARQASEIVAARSAALGRTAGSSVPSYADIERGRQQRRQVLESLERVRSELWTMPDQELTAALDGISAANYEDLREPVTRLAKIAAERGVLLELKTEMGFTPIVFQSLERILTHPRRETAAAREQFLNTIALPQFRKKRRIMVERVRQKAPYTYQLESELFDSLLKRNMRRGLPWAIKRPAPTTDARESNYSWAYWLVGVAALQLLRAIFGG
jgi:hypothetical protein